MDVDPPEGSTAVTNNGATDQAVEKAADELGEILAHLEDHPQNVPYLRRQIHLLQILGLATEAQDAILKLSSLVMLDEDMWLAFFDILLEASPRPLSLDSFVEILERFDQAERDYLTTPILLRHLEFVLLCARSGSPGMVTAEGIDTLDVDGDITEFLTPDTVRAMAKAIVFQRAYGLLGDSHLLWQPWIDWEMAQLSAASDRSAQVEQIHSLYLERLGIPHTTIETTLGAYSTFCSEQSPDSYESRMVEATAASQTAKFKYSQEKRYGKTREDLEQELAYAGDSTIQLQTLATYIDWETDQRARNPKNPGKSPETDLALTRAIFERTVALHSRIVAPLVASLSSLELVKPKKTSRKGKDKAQDEGEAESMSRASLHAYKQAEAAVWEKYAIWLEDSESKESALLVRQRAVRACPQIGSVWSALLTSMEQESGDLEESTSVFEQALAIGLLDEPGTPTTETVDLFLSRAASEARTSEDVEGETHPVLLTLSRAFQVIEAVNRAGDSSLRLEKFLLDWAETRAPEFLDQAIALIDKPNKSRQASYIMVTTRTGVETRRGNLEQSRKIFLAAIQRSDLDWPEAVYEAFLQFESVHGDLDSLGQAKSSIRKEQEKVAKRREKAAQEQAAQYSTEYAMPVSEAPPVTMVANGGSSEEVIAQGAADSQTQEEESHLKRDREHTTVLVTGLRHGIEAAQLESFFAESGRVREITILPDSDGESDAALVEFRSAEAIPAALGRDRKKLGGSEIHVSMLWRSTLFVTNFPRDMDDGALRKLLSDYGRVLQTRWPSRKYADNRRFCYVTMNSPASAENALQLHGQPTKEGFSLSVLISDPSKKVKRTDASNATVFVNGLTAKTTETDIQNLFGQRGQVKAVKLGWNAEKQICKGFAFVEMATEADAKEALNLHGFHVNGRYLKVEMSDPNIANKKRTTNPGQGSDAAMQAAEKRARTVRLHNLPEDTQEGLLQQALEKLVPVRRLELFASSHEAIAELESQADAGKLLLRTEPFVFNGVTVEIREQQRRPHAPVPKREDGRGAAAANAMASSSGTPAASSGSGPSSLAFAPRAARRGGRGIGRGRQAPTSDRALPNFVPASSDGQGGGAVGQDAFRALVAAKNKQREENLASKQSTSAAAEEETPAGTAVKRPAEEAEEGAAAESGAKRPKTEEQQDQ